MEELRQFLYNVITLSSIQTYHLFYMRKDYTFHGFICPNFQSFGIDHTLVFQMSLYVGSVLVVLDMILTILALVLNLAVVIGLRYRYRLIISDPDKHWVDLLLYRNTQDSVDDNNNVLQLNLVLNNLIICVLVKSFEEMTVLLLNW